MSYLQFEPLISLSLWCALAVAAVAALVVYGVGSRGRLARRHWWVVLALMTIAVVMPLAILLNPTWIERLPPPQGKPRLTVLVDRSASMAVTDAVNGASRFASAAQTVKEVQQKLGDKFDVQIRTFADTSTPASADDLLKQSPEGAATNLAVAVEDALSDELPQGQTVLLLSDGGHNEGGQHALREAVAKAKTMASPVYVHTIGGQTQVRDLAVELAAAEELAFIDQRVPVSVKLVQRGPLSKRVNVSLRLDGKLLESKPIELDASESLTEKVFPVDFQVSQKKPGVYRYQVEVDALPEEVSPVNNAAALLLRVVDEPMQVVLLEGKPYWDTKFLVRTLAQDRSVELTSVVQMAPGRVLKRRIARPENATADVAQENSGENKSSDDEKHPHPGPVPKGEGEEKGMREDRWEILADAGSFLTNPDSLKNAQIVVLGRDADVFLTDAALDQLRKWLAGGNGALVCFRGPPESQLTQRLGRLMPLRWTSNAESRFRMSLDRAGQAVHWLPAAADADALAVMPSLATSGKPERRSPGVGVLATIQGEETPVLAYQEFGLGRVVVIEGAGMWRWAFLAPKHQEQEEIYGMLWRSLTRWLVSNVGLLPNQQLALRMDRVTYATGQNISAQLLVREGQFPQGLPEVTLDGGALSEPRKIEPIASDDPGRFVIPVGELPEGRYTLKINAPGVNDTSGTALFDVQNNLRERLEVSARGDLMRSLVAEPSGGAVLDGNDIADQLVKKFDEQQAANRPEQILRTTAWDRWWVLATLFGGWALAWSQRRRWGLV